MFVTGYLYGSGSGHHEDYATVAYAAATGAQLWSRLYNPGDLPDYGRSVAISPDGSRVFVTGSSEGTGSSSDYATLAYDADTGAGLWVSRYTGLGGKRVDEGAALAVSPDGSRVFVTGWSSEGYLNPDYATLAYDAATGAPLWLMRYNGPAGREDEANGLAVAPDGTKVFVTGSSVSSLGGDDYLTLAYQA